MLAAFGVKMNLRDLLKKIVSGYEENKKVWTRSHKDIGKAYFET